MRAFLEKRKPDWVAMIDPPPAHRQPRRDRACASSAPAASGHRDASRSTPTPTPARRTCARPIAPCASGPPPPAESYLTIAGAPRRRARDRRRRGPSRLRLPLGARARSRAPCEEAGLIFVGPPADVIERMGSKIGARALMAGGRRAGRARRDAGRSDRRRRARRPRTRSAIPVLVKASAGGGGKGMRVVRDDGEARDAIAAARREATAAFGDGTLYVERLIERPRHVEIQVFADDHGHVVHLFERECSVQRRHQKVDRGEPVAGADAGAARAHGRGGGRRGARRRLSQRRHGRVPARRRRRRRAVLLPRDEHAAAGRASGHRSGDRRRPGARAAARSPPASRCRGRRTRCRSAATRSSAASTPRIRRSGFLPQAGPLLLYREPSGPGIRVDSGVAEGGDVSVSTTTRCSPS